MGDQGYTLCSEMQKLASLFQQLHGVPAVNGGDRTLGTWCVMSECGSHLGPGDLPQLSACPGQLSLRSGCPRGQCKAQ